MENIEQFYEFRMNQTIKCANTIIIITCTKLHFSVNIIIITYAHHSHSGFEIFYLNFSIIFQIGLAMSDSFDSAAPLRNQS